MRIVIIGLVFLFLWFFGGISSRHFYQDFVEQDLQKRTQLLLEEHGIEDLQVSYDHFFANISGEVTSLEQRQNIVALVRERVPGVEFDGRSIRVEPDFLPMVSNPEKAAQIQEKNLASQVLPKDRLELTPQLSANPHIQIFRRGSQLSIIGILPEKGVQEALLDSLRVANPASEIADQSIADGAVASPWWASRLVQTVPFFFEKTEGDAELRISGQEIYVNGVVASEESLSRILASLGRGMPEEFTIVPELDVRLAKSNALLRGSFDSEARFVLEGQVGSLTEKNVILSALRQADSDQMVIDEIRIDATIGPQVWRQSPTGILSMLFAEATNEFFELRADSMRLEGEIASEEIRERLLEEATAVLGSKSGIRDQLRVVDRKEGTSASISGQSVAAIKNQKLEGEFRKAAVYFASNSAEVPREDANKIEQMFELIRQVDSQYQLVVGGYADRSGDERINRELSLARANAVRDRLIQFGVAPERLVVEYFGEDKSNRDVSEFWKARRVELSIRKLTNRNLID